jgi:hypothetical protein
VLVLDGCCVTCDAGLRTGAGFEVSSETSVISQLACILRMRGRALLFVEGGGEVRNFCSEMASDSACSRDTV